MLKNCKSDTLEDCKHESLENCKVDNHEAHKEDILQDNLPCKDCNLRDCKCCALEDCEEDKFQDYVLPDCTHSTLKDCEDDSLQHCNVSTLKYCENEKFQYYTIQGCTNGTVEDCEGDKIQDCTHSTLEDCEDDSLHDCQEYALKDCEDETKEKLVDSEEDKLFNYLFKCLPEVMKEDKRFIITGNIPGYLICSLCTVCIVTTPFHLKSHLSNFWHNKNKENPFHLPDYSREVPNPVKLTGYRVLNVSAMTFFMLVVKTNDSALKNNIKYISKQLGKNEYYCQLCNKMFSQSKPSKLVELLTLHFEGKEHSKNKYSPLRFKLKEDRFLMFDNIPMEVYEDIQLFKVLPPQDGTLSSDHNVFCSVCKDSLPLDLTVLVDHIQSKQHVKIKIMFKMSKKLKKMSSTIDEVFVKISSKNENFKCMRQHFTPDSDCIKIVCTLCNTTVGNATDTVIDLENKCLRHLKNKEHTLNPQEASCYSPNSNIVNKSMLEKLFKSIHNFDKSNKNVIVISKKPGYIKCKVCSSRFVADLNSLKELIEKKYHKKNVEIWKDNKHA